MKAWIVRILSAFLVLVAVAQAAERVALVVGNNEYRHAQKLVNPVRDARAVAGALRQVGFEVTTLEDAGVERFYEGIEAFKKAAAGAKVGLVYYAGHGIEVDGKNWLLPVDAELANPAQLRTQAVSLDTVLADVVAVRLPVKAVILDCCRDNPLGRSWRRTRSAGSGLAEVKDTILPEATMVMFSAGPGQVAADGVGANSPFTAALVRRLVTPGQSLFDAFIGTSDDVMAVTGRRQEPWVKFDGAGRAFRQLVFVPGNGGIRPMPVPEITPAPDRPRWRQGFQAGERLTVEVAPGVEMAFRWCPPGSFTMGSPESEKEALRKAGVQESWFSGETPHEVKLSQGFWLAETEVTQGQWQAVMKTSLLEQANKALADDEEYSFGGTKKKIRDWMNLKSGQGDRAVGVQYGGIAMYYVNWHEAEDFCRRVSPAVAGKGWGLVMRLPTEAQWEYACRAGTRAMSYAGDFEIKGEHNAPGLDAIAWYGGNSSRGYEGKGWNTAGLKDKQYPGGTAGPRRVGQKRPNAWGLHDMLGNVWEWCGDWYGGYPATSVTDPQGPATGVYRVYRGGSWFYLAADCRAAGRGGIEPGYRYIALGFRPALVPSE